MAAVLPSLNIDKDSLVSKHFLPYQMMWILDESRMRLAEKSVRIGWTFCDAFKNVRKRLRVANRDYLFATKDQMSAVEYMQTCMKFADIFDFAKSIKSHGEDSTTITAQDDDGKKFTQEVKFNYIKFDNGSRIIAFSSNPYAMAVFGGDVGLDEYAKHPQAVKLWETAQGRATWGYDIGVWSAHDGTDTQFYQFSREAASGKAGWSHYKVTMEDAVEMGLVEKINETRGTNLTREGFIQDCKDRARLPEIYQQAYNCNPTGSASAIVPWNTVLSNRKEYAIERVHMEANQVSEQFGTYTKHSEHAREQAIAGFISSAFFSVCTATAHHSLGFDVAASGEGDLASIWIDERRDGMDILRALFTCRTDDWHFLKNVLWTFLRRVPAIVGAGDETGLGRQICWETKVLFPGAFEGVNFSGKKHDMGFGLMNQLSVHEKIMPAANAHDDIAQDIFSIRKTFTGGRWIFTSGRNNLNPASHGDIAWSAALSSYTNTLDLAAGGGIQLVAAPRRKGLGL